MQTYGHVPKVAMIQEWKGKVADLVKNHVKRSRPSLSDKVAKLVKEMARESNQVSGKWMVFENQTRDMEGKWSKVKLALARSTLGPVAKLSESLCAGGRVMCIYTKSFEDFSEDCADGVDYLVVMELESHLHVKADEFGQVPVGVGIFRSENATDGENFSKAESNIKDEIKQN